MISTPFAFSDKHFGSSSDLLAGLCHGDLMLPDFIFLLISFIENINGTHCATSRKVSVSISVGVTEFFIDLILPAALRPWGRLNF